MREIRTEMASVHVGGNNDISYDGIMFTIF